MKASISKTYFKEVDGKLVFCKLKEVSNFDIRTLVFQAKLSEIINGIFSINKFLGINFKQLESKTYFELEFENVEQKIWEPNHNNMRLIGTSMAHLHNYAYYNKNLLNLSVKNETYSDMSNWLILSKKSKQAEEAYKMRLEIFNNINRFNRNQPKIGLHRDFKLHNILYNGKSYVLIDFDFAAVDYVSIEIMGFIVDVIDYGIEYVKTFFEAYHNTINIPVISKDYVSDYLNYLCTNTFPFYIQEQIEAHSFNYLVEYRNKCLKTIYENRDIINKTIEESKYVSN